jgi:hypothetical protein
MPWSLEDAEALAAAAPRTFFIPPAEIRHGLKVGDQVKLLFALEREDGALAKERMWVDVVETDPYAGTLANEPELDGVIAFGDRVAFRPEHVAGYGYEPGSLGYDPAEACHVSRAVVDGDDPPRCLHLADAEWTATHGDEPTELTWRLGYLTDRFPVTEAPLREGAERHGLLRRRPRDVTWRFEGGAYVRGDA